ncbi:hypothetical protein AWRI1631_132640 [Saccharomyces cerevisiae AWRI1631]|uniref:Uncharacterized protein n=1 Tax=Saccharomyces cerevisiae (strain AWRI1631) TaxID=545124 RepID=B5VPP7_YEAS6|nr:hypothetical protein AWRI1631_132640 [Saccharomyces cerevisiae AWRI1631]
MAQDIHPKILGHSQVISRYHKDNNNNNNNFNFIQCLKAIGQCLYKVRTFPKGLIHGHQMTTIVKLCP